MLIPDWVFFFQDARAHSSRFWMPPRRVLLWHIFNPCLGGEAQGSAQILCSVASTLWTQNAIYIIYHPSSDLIFPAARNLSSLVSVGPSPRCLMNLWKNATEVGNYLVWLAALHNKFLKKLPKDILIDGVPSSLTQPDIGDFQFSMCMATRMARFCLTGKVGRRARKLALMSWTATPTTLATRNAKKKKTQGLISPVLAGFHWPSWSRSLKQRVSI